MWTAIRALSVILLALGSGTGPGWAFAPQVPPHPPGTICFTPQFWCWAQPPGPSGAPCGCPSAYGWVRGILG